MGAFKGWQSTRRNPLFANFPNISFPITNSAYGFTGCTFWLDAAYGLNTQTDLAAVTYWEDRIQNIRFVQTAAANQPRLVVADASFNNLPCIDFYSNARRMLSVNAFGLSNLFTMGIVAKITSSVSGKNILFSLNNSTTLSGLIVLTHTNASSGFGIYNNNAINFADPTPNDTNPHIIILKNDEIMIDGVQVVTGSYTIQTSYNSLGTTSTTGTVFGKVAEVVLYDDNINATTLSTRLNSKYAIY